MRDIDPATVGSVLKTLAQVNLPEGRPAGEGDGASAAMPGIVLGKELAKNLGVVVGDVVQLISPRGMPSPVGHVPSMKQFKVTGYFESGMYEYDQTFAYINLHDAQRLLKMGDAVSGIEMRVTDIYQAPEVADAGLSRLGPGYYARDWMQLNRNLFKALKLERRVMFSILTLIVLVAAFNIASSLIMNIRQFRLLLLAREILDAGGRMEDIARELGLARFVAEKIVGQARRTSLDQLERVYHRLLVWDEAIKSGLYEDEIMLDTLAAEFTIQQGRSSR